MLSATKHIKEVSVLRRMLFAATYLPEDVPNYWETLVSFGTVGKGSEPIKVEEAGKASRCGSC